MKIIKKILVSILILIVLTAFGGYIYFNQKFTPEKNYLTLENESGRIPIKWIGNDKNVLLLPIHFQKDSTTYYLQFDTGATYTEFYYNSIKDIKGISINNHRATATFYLGNTKVTSHLIKVSNIGKVHDKNDSVKIIGTLGADIIENRKTVINLKENCVVFNLSQCPAKFKNNLIDFEFKKRKIIIHADLEGNSEKFLYDSGTSAYELLTSKEIWESLKLPRSKVIIEKPQSRSNILTSYTAKSNRVITFKNKNVPLTEVTYVEGFTATQYMLMKFSGMTGMLGNKIFLNHTIYIDCAQEKIGIE